MACSMTFQQISGSYQLSKNSILSDLRMTDGLPEEGGRGQAYALEKSLLQTEHENGLSWVSATDRQPSEDKRGHKGAVIAYVIDDAEPNGLLGYSSSCKYCTRKGFRSPGRQ